MRAKKVSYIQYGYRKWRTPAEVFFQTLVHGKRMSSSISERMKEDKETDQEGKLKKSQYGKTQSGTKERSPNGLVTSLAYHPLGSLLSEAVEELPNLPLTLHL